MQPNNPQQFTEKAWSAIARTPDIAKENNHQQIETEHLLKALLEQKGLAVSIFNKTDANVNRLLEKTEQFIANQPKVKKYWRISLFR